MARNARTTVVLLAITLTLALGVAPIAWADVSGSYDLVGPPPAGGDPVPVKLELLRRGEGVYAVTHRHVLGGGAPDLVLRGTGRETAADTVEVELREVLGVRARIAGLLGGDPTPRVEASGTFRFDGESASGVLRVADADGNTRELVERAREVTPPEDPAGGGEGGSLSGSNDTPVPIQDFRTVTSTITIDEDGEVADLNLDVDIQHTYIGDLRVSLTSPSGEEVVLHNRTGRGTDDIVGNYPADRVPAQSLDAFVGEPTKGDWTLTVRDNARADQGQIRGWNLDITPVEPEEPEEPEEELDEDFVNVIPSREIFEALARRDNVPGAIGVREVKFLVTGVDTPSPRLYFINTKKYAFHYDFASRGLGLPLSLRQFNAQTYFTDNRRFMAGSIIAHDQYEHPETGLGIYTTEFWPTDPVKVRHVDIAYQRVVSGMPFASEKIYYHPASETQKGLYRDEKPEFDARRIKVIGTDELFANVTYSPLNLGEGYGLLRVVDGASDRPPSIRDIVIFKTLPNDLSHVAGVITEVPQTPLSHINLKAKQNDTPNAFIKNAAAHERIAPLVGKIVHFVVTPDDFIMEEATQAELDAFFEAVRPTEPQIPVRDLSVTDVQRLDDLGNADTKSVGAKAANVAELRKILPEGIAPNGFAIPFALYDQFMKANGFYVEARVMMADEAFQTDPAEREKKLKKFRKKIKRAPVPPDVSAKLAEIQASFPPDQPIRMRSSTNNEDLAGFNGAGLYDSKTHRPDEGHIENTVKQVWASLWNYRAYEEREFYRIPHDQAAMGVLAHPNYDDEIANGVAVTKNIYDPNFPGFYVNVQAGESLVTNPEAGATPDEFLRARLGPRGEYETQFIRKSNVTPEGQGSIMTPAQVDELTGYMERIQEHFKVVYGAQDDPNFAMDIEFKVDKDNKLAIKQARPWVD